MRGWARHVRTRRRSKLICELDRQHFGVTSDSSIVTGLLALIQSVHDARRPAEHLSLSRRNGVSAVLGRIRAAAAAA